MDTSVEPTSLGITNAEMLIFIHLQGPLAVFLIYKHNRGGILKPQLSGIGRFPGNNRPELSNNKKKAT